MKKKIRDIVVNDIKYAWRIRYYDTLVIYEDKKIIYESRCDVFPITPKVVEDVINNLKLKHIMDIPDFSKPSKDCHLSTDKNGTKLKVGDVISSNLRSFRGGEKKVDTYEPIQEWNNNLIIPHYGSFLLDWFVKTHCTIVT